MNKLILANEIQTINIVFLVIDILIVIAAFIFLIWMYVKIQRVNLRVRAKENAKEVKRIDDDTFVLLSKENLNKTKKNKDNELKPEKQETDDNKVFETKNSKNKK